MQRDISNKNTLGDTLNPINDSLNIQQQLRELPPTTMMQKKKCKKYEISLEWENSMQTWQNIFQVSWI